MAGQTARVSLRAHLRESVRWSAAETGSAAMLGAGLSIAGPLLFAALQGDLRHGFVAARGGLLIGGIDAGRSWRDQAQDLARVLAPAMVATAATALVTGHGWHTDAIVIGLAGVAALVGGLSRDLARATMQFTLFLIIATGVAETSPVDTPLALLMLAGMTWAVVVNLVVGTVFRLVRRDDPVADAETTPEPSWSQRIVRWRRTLATRAGWQFALRLVFCLSAASVLRWIFPNDHLHWVMMTVALLLERSIDAFPVKTTQRALGTALGVIIAAVFLESTLSAAAVVIAVAMLGALRPLLRLRNYLLYSAVMTPLVMVVMDAGQPVAAGLLADRLLATVLGAALVIGANALVGRWMLRAP
jgi:uncharacterized membrane protein YccC